MASFHFPFNLAGLLVSLVCGMLVSGCGTFPGWLPSAGPSRDQVLDAENAPPAPPIQVVEVNDAVARRILAGQKRSVFSETLGGKGPGGYIVGPGDMVEISIWESPPAVLFGASTLDPRSGASAQVTAFPPQMVSSDGTINIPFAGRIAAAGKSPQQIENDIIGRLSGKANQPQVLLRVTNNATSTVTVVGEVAQSTRVPLTARGERLLDALAAAGGVRQPVGKVTLQLTRGAKVQAMALDAIIRDPRQNIFLQPGDVITALFQSSSFTVLGATGKNEEINFEAQGITLAQALGRSGGLQDSRADARAVFIFRFEDRTALDWKTPPKTTPEGKVPVIYQVNLKDPTNFFVAQSFPIMDKDMLYVSTAPATELQKFLNLVTGPIIAVDRLQQLTE